MEPRSMVLDRHLVFRLCHAAARAAAIVLLALMATGCGSSGPAEPRMRLGSIPFPGPFTLYTTADPNDLGQHRYEEWWDTHTGPDETTRGILYTCRAGFIDLAHVRESMDIVKYAHDRILERLLDKDGASPICGGTFRLNWADARYDAVIRPPEGWTMMDAAERQEIAHELAIRAAERFSIIVGTWHEIGTFYGQQTVPPFSEKTSAFTYDDATSHVVAATVAGRALRDRERDGAGVGWNVAATVALNEHLVELGVVSVDCQYRAVQGVRNLWWKSLEILRRDLDVGLSGNVKIPWLVPGLDCCPDAQMMPLTLSDLSNVNGRDLRCCLEVQIRPGASMIRRTLRCSSCPEAITTEGEILRAIETLRADLKARDGPDADHP